MKKAKCLEQASVQVFWTLTSIANPMTVIVRCQTAIERANQLYWKKRQTYLGVLTAMSERICRIEESWGQFIKEDFWKKAYGGRPAMKDRSDCLAFVIRYGEKAITRKKYKLAWRHTVVAKYLLSCGVKPIDFAAYLGKPGQGINATYKKAQAEQRTTKESASVTGATNPKKPTKVAATEQSTQAKQIVSVNCAKKGAGADVQGAASSQIRMGKLIGKAHLMQPLFLLAEGSRISVLIKASRDEEGRRCLKIVKLLSNPATEQRTAERKKSNKRRLAPTTGGVKHTSRKHHRAAR